MWHSAAKSIHHTEWTWLLTNACKWRYWKHRGGGGGGGGGGSITVQKTAAFVTGKSNKEYVKKGRYDPIALPENVKFGPWTKYI